MPTMIARTLLKGGLAFLTLGAVLVLAGAASPSFAEPERSGDRAEAHWRLHPDAGPPDFNSTSFVAAVWRAGCGAIGPVDPPSISYGEHQILVTFTVAPNQGGECPIPPPVRYEVQLKGRIAGRELVDTWCLVPEHEGNYFCDGGAVRWSTG